MDLLTSLLRQTVLDTGSNKTAAACKRVLGKLAECDSSPRDARFGAVTQAGRFIINEHEMALHNLDALVRCRRCSCLSCDRGGGDEMHDHICTQGDNCVDTRENILRRLYAFSVAAGQARTIIKQLIRERDALQSKTDHVIREEAPVNDVMAEAAGRTLARGIHMAWDGLAPGKVQTQYPAWGGGGHANAHQGDYIELGRQIVEAALKARVPSIQTDHPASSRPATNKTPIEPVHIKLQASIPPPWAKKRRTHPAIADAIFALSTDDRWPDALWAFPTLDEWDQIRALVEKYFAQGLYDQEDDGRYQWGAAFMTIRAPT